MRINFWEPHPSAIPAQSADLGGFGTEIMWGNKEIINEMHHLSRKRLLYVFLQPPNDVWPEGGYELADSSRLERLKVLSS